LRVPSFRSATSRGSRRTRRAGCCGLLAIGILILAVAAQAQQPSSESALLGTWQAKSGPAGTQVTTRLALRPDGSFMEQSFGPATQPTSMWGRYLVLESGRLQLEVSGWYPQQSCTRQGCTLVSLQRRQVVSFQLIGSDMLQLGQDLFARMP
jgi:hypothetical protein